jgi:hypothetical protein
MNLVYSRTRTEYVFEEAIHLGEVLHVEWLVHSIARSPGCLCTAESADFRVQGFIVLRQFLA